MKTKEGSDAMKNEAGAGKLNELTDEKLERVSGGAVHAEGYHCSNENCVRHRIFLDKQGTCYLCGAELVYGKMGPIT